MPGLLQPLLDAAVMGFGAAPAAELHLWAGVNLPLALSLATFGLGGCCSWPRRVFWRAGPGFPLLIAAGTGCLWALPVSQPA